MKVPWIDGNGNHGETESESYALLVLLPDACADIPRQLWDWFDVYEEPVRGPVREPRCREALPQRGPSRSR